MTLDTGSCFSLFTSVWVWEMNSQLVVLPPFLPVAVSSLPLWTPALWNCKLK